MVLKKSVEQRLWKQHNGTGYLVLKTSKTTLMSVEVFLKPNGTLCRIHDGRPALPIRVEPWEDE